MYRYLLPAIFMLFWGSHAQAQQYLGRGAITLESEGTQSATQLTTQQVAGKYDASKQEAHFYFKSLSLAFKQDQATKEMVTECFITQGYPVANLRIQQLSMQDLDKGQAKANAKLSLMGHDFEVPIVLTSSMEGNVLSLSGKIDIDLQNEQIQLPQTYLDRMGHKMSFQFDQFLLISR